MAADVNGEGSERDAARAEARQRLVALAAASEGELPLDEVIALVAVEEDPSVDAAALLGELDQLARGLYLREGAAPHEVVARVNHHLFQTHGFAGDLDDYDAPHNSLLDHVLRRRRGLPILLCIVYLEVARRAGGAFDGIGFPGHFLVAHRGGEGPRWFVDPFHGGRVLREEQLLERVRHMANGAPVPRAAFEQVIAPVDARYVAVRVNNNLKGAWLRRGEVEPALRAVERLLILEPDLAEERRDRGLMLAHLGRAEEAAVELRSYLELAPNAPDRHRIERRLAELDLEASELAAATELKLGPST